MDKGGGEHQVALQRLEDALNAFQMHAPVVESLLARRKGLFHPNRRLSGFLQNLRPQLEQIHAFQPYWKELDLDLLVNLARSVWKVVEGLEAYEKIRAQARSFAGIEFRGSFFHIEDEFKIKLTITKSRNELDSLRVRAFFSPNPETEVGERASHGPLDGTDAVKDPDATQFLLLASEFERHAESLLKSWQKHRVFKNIRTLFFAVSGPAMIVLTIISLLNRDFQEKSTLNQIFNGLSFVWILLYSFTDVCNWITERNSIHARARLLFAVGDYIRQVQGAVSSAAIVDIVAFAAHHRNDEATYPGAFDLKLKEFEAIIAGNPPAGSQAATTATQ